MCSILKGKTKSFLANTLENSRTFDSENATTTTPTTTTTGNFLFNFILHHILSVKWLESLRFEDTSHTYQNSLNQSLEL